MDFKFIGNDPMGVLVTGEYYSPRWYEKKENGKSFIVLEIDLDGEDPYNVSYNSRKEVWDSWERV